MGDPHDLSVDLYWSFRSPYSYLATPRLREIARDYAVSFHVKPVYPLAIRTPNFFEENDPLWLSYMIKDVFRMRTAMRYLAIAVALLFVGLTGCTPENASETKSADAEFTHTIYLVRHAEKGAGDNPGLTEVGHARALALKDKLKDAGITRIYSSDYKRTQQTAKPLADHRGLSVISYDPRDLDGFAKELSSQTGLSLVVGHSNTTPQLAKALGGGEAIYMPETEYDRFIEIKLGNDGKVLKSTSRYGAAP